MEIHFHTHRAKISGAMRKRAERLVSNVGLRIPRVHTGVIHFSEDGATRSVALTLRAPRHHDLHARAEGRYFGPALASAIQRVLAQASREKMGNGKERAHRLARERA